MASEIALARELEIRKAGHDEYWLQDQIAAEPACLGLGDELEVVQRERQQASGGRLDLLLKDSETDTMYEVELQLGPTDESHIIRTIEYWDNEKRKWPKRQHVAVLVAERITTRFYNVIRLLSHGLPVVAVQVNLIQIQGNHCLHFVKILDTYEEPVDEEQPLEVPKDEAYWRDKASWTLETAIALRDEVASVIPEPALRFNQDHIVITVADKGYMWLHRRSSGNSFLAFRVKGPFQGELDNLLAQHRSPLQRRDKWCTGKINKEFVATSVPLLKDLMRIVDKSVRV